MRGLQRRSGYFLRRYRVYRSRAFSGKWLGACLGLTTGLALTAHAADPVPAATETATPSPLDDLTSLQTCPDMMAARRNAARLNDSTAPRPREKPTASDVPFDVEANDVSIDAKGATHLKGGGRVRQGNREIRAEEVEYNASRTTRSRSNGHVEFDDPVVHATRRRRQLLRNRRRAVPRCRVRAARTRGARRSAEHADDAGWAHPPQRRELHHLPARRRRVAAAVRTASTLDTRTRIGTGRGTRVDFKGVPIMYLPWMSFPLGTERKSGFLFPTLGHSTRGGVQFALPYYWNIAPQRGPHLRTDVLLASRPRRQRRDALPQRALQHDARVQLSARTTA